MNDVLKTGNKPVKVTDDILQLTDTPDIVTSGDGEKYIGYEHIGGAYSGNYKYLIPEWGELFASYIAQVTGDGIFLDLGCGDGCITVPCAKLGIKIIAGDISNTMMTILKERARRNNVPLDNVTLCRMNALDIPIKDNSVDCVIANSVLHLISNPEKVISEIYRVLKPKGRFVCKDDAPGRDVELVEEYERENKEYLQILNEIYNSYWADLNLQGVTPKKYSWRFDRDAVCLKLFGKSETKRIEHSKPYFNKLVDSWLPRFIGRGYSDQVDVPPELHKTVCDKVIAACRAKYGEKFDAAGFHGVEGDIILTSYIK